MDGGKRAGVAGIEGIEQRARLDSANFAKDDSVGSPAESRLQKVIEGDTGFERIRLAFDRKDVRLLDAQLGRILNNHDALVVGDGIGEDAQKRGLAGSRSAADEQCLATADLFCKKLCKWPRQRAASNQVIDGVMAAGKFSDRKRGSRPHNRRNDCCEATSIWKLSIE